MNEKTLSHRFTWWLRFAVCAAVLVVLGIIAAQPTTLLAQAEDVEASCPVDPPAKIVWVSPRGTLEVMDDYPLIVAQKLGYFEALGLEVELQPGPMGGNVMALLSEGQGDVGFPSPGVLASSIDQGIPVIIAWEMANTQVFNFAIRADNDAINTVEDLAGKTISLGSAGWQPIVDPILAEAGVDISTVTYVEAGNQWGQSVAQGQADAALSWEGLRAQWDSIGLDFKYLIGSDFSKDPSNGYAVRTADLEDPAKTNALACFFRGVAMGLEFGRANPQAAAQITYEEFPALQDQMTPELALESMRQLMYLYNNAKAAGFGFGYGDEANWQNYLDRIFELGQTQRQLSVSEVITNQFVATANDYDADAVIEDAMNYPVSEEWAALELQGPIEPPAM